MDEKIKFGYRFRNYPLPKRVDMIVKGLKRLMVSLAGVAFFTDQRWVIVFAVASWVLDEVQEFFGSEQIIS